MKTRQTSAPLYEHSLGDQFREAHGLVGLLREGSMSYDLPYQRGDVWTLDQRIGLVRSWLQGLPVPAIVVNNRGYDQQLTYAVIDGKQRLTTARMWFDGEFAVPASWFEAGHVADPYDIATDPAVDEYADTGLYVRFTGLTPVGRRRLARRARFPFAEAHVATVEEEAALYLLLNGGGTPHTEADLARAEHVAQAGE